MRGIDSKMVHSFAVKVIYSIVEIYIAEMDAHYVRTGEGFNALVKGDLVFCGELYTSLNSES